ncbi:hypothetical protein STW0522KLE44_03530 [Klebsiella sp. STW0522-44]|nr:hypothetical protein STW0522KLE44_03530 [Klebsiella sp. STW0522-44]
MKDELFADLLASAEEMVRIEKGDETPKPEHVHTFSEIDVKAIREATGLRQQDFAIAVGVSYDLVKSWEKNVVSQRGHHVNSCCCFRPTHSSLSS